MALVPGPGVRCRSLDMLVADEVDGGLAEAHCGMAPALRVHRARPVESITVLVDELASPAEYLVGIDPGESRTGLAVLAAGSMIYSGVYKSLAGAVDGVCRLASTTKARVTVGVGYSPSVAELAHEAASLLSGCGNVEVVLVDESESNRTRLPSRLRPHGRLGGDHVHAATAIALKASMEPRGASP